MEAFQYSAGLLFLAGLSREDIRERRISLYKPAFFGAVGLFYGCCIEGNLPYEMLCRALPGGLFLLLAACTKEAVGYGDGAVILVLGLWLGELFTFFTVAAAFCMAGIYGAYCRIRGKKEPFPFVPFLLSGMEVCLACIKN